MPSKLISIRRAAFQDLPAILEVEQASPMAAHWTAEQYQGRLADGYVVVAEQEGKVCGFLCARVVADEWEIENVVVESGFLRRGAADRLMLALIEEARAHLASQILLEVRESNLPARGLYEKHGFRQVGRRAQYYRDPLEDAILYARSGCGEGQQ